MIELEDNKVRAMYDLVHQLKKAPYDPKLLHSVLTKIENRGIPYLLDQLPENQTYEYYCEKLDDYLVGIIKTGR